MDTAGIEQMLSALQQTSAAAANKKVAPADSAAGSVDFADVLKSSIDKVNATQQQATQMQKDFVAGDSTQNLHEVMVALQTASVSFQEMVQVRNKLVTAYQDVMSMQV